MSRSVHEQCVPCHRGRGRRRRNGCRDGPADAHGTEVASYETYAQARAGVDFLSDAGFDVSAITIVGSDLHLVERVKDA